MNTKSLRVTLLVSVFAGVLALTPAPFAYAQQNYDDGLQLRVSDLEQQIRTLTDQVERKDFEVRALRTDLNKLEKQIADLSAPAAAPAPTSSFETPAADAPAAETAAPAATSPVRAPAADDAANAPYSPTKGTTPELGTVGEPKNGVPSKISAAKDYDAAYAALQAGKYSDAEQKFMAFLNLYPDHTLAPNAQYWVGEAQYTQNKFGDAARSFAKSFQSYPKSQKAPDSLLKLAATLDKMGKTKEACLTLKETKTRFPSASPALLKRAEDESTRLACTVAAAQ